VCEESASDHESSFISLTMNTSERDDTREPGYEADRELSTDESRGNVAAAC